ncbi:MAG: ERF family protein [Pseudomonadota bacterium]
MTEIATIALGESRGGAVSSGSADPWSGLIERVLSNPDLPLDRVQQVLDMREKVQAEEARKAFYDAMAAAKTKIMPVARDRHNEQTRSTYARLEAIARAIDPIIARHGFSMSFRTDASPIEGHYRITCELGHRQGHTKSYHADIPSDQVGIKGSVNKTKIHAFGSSITYGRRYLKLLVWDIATEDDDGNAAGRGEVETISEDQARELETLILNVGADREKFLALGRLERMEDMPLSEFDNARAMLVRKGEEARRNG